MKLSKILITSVLLTLLLTACSINPPKVTYDGNTNFDSLNTYNWLDTPQSAEIDQLEKKLVKIAVDRQMARKGFRLVPENPDFLVTQNLSKELVYDRHWERDIRESMGPMYFFKYAYQKGTLIIEIVNPQMNKIIWKGRESSVVERVITTESRRKRINETVAKIMENFPPLQKQAITKLDK